MTIKSIQGLRHFDCTHEVCDISVHGRFVRKRSLSYVKEYLLSRIIHRSHASLRSLVREYWIFAAIRQINWDVHLGDMVTVRGVLQRKHSEAGYSNGLLVDLVSIRVDEPWCLHYTGTVFNYTVSDVAPPTTLLW
ncbi:hypothetical protein PsorP6_003363 [Peronosclerospora sorghi]|uniref:Uncharacterized protein n=1 Tax=Peronosclerospora sorghi TaxID=230839 RepID=A0ACC0VIJ7_9STRA|nr:hypothetical protein PsorP6_003363 [Peronosclerospora sorghi]